MKRNVLVGLVAALPLVLIGGTANAQSYVPEQDVYFDAVAPYCSGDFTLVVCTVPSDEPLVSQGTVVKATAINTWLGNHTGALYAKLVVPGGYNQIIPLNDGLGAGYFSDTFDVGQSYVMATVPKALNWNVEQSLARRTSWCYLEIGGSNEDGSGVLDLISRIPINLVRITEPAATMPAGSPRAVAAARTGQNAAKITWSAPTPPKGHTIVGYRVARNGVDTYGGGAYAKTLGAAARSFTMNYLVLGDTYALSVTALYSGGTRSATASAAVFIG